MKKGDILSFAAGANVNEYFEYSIEWDRIMPLVDNVNLMTYDFYGSGSRKTGHHTPLGTNNFKGGSVVSSIKALIKLGVKPEKIIIGAAFYIKTFKNVKNVKNGLDQSGTSSRSYNQVNFDEARSNFSFHWVSLAKAPFA